MVDEVLLEHEAPSFHRVEQYLFEGRDVNLEPEIEHLFVRNCRHFVIDALICVDLTHDYNLLTHILMCGNCKQLKNFVDITSNHLLLELEECRRNFWDSLFSMLLDFL